MSELEGALPPTHVEVPSADPDHSTSSEIPLWLVLSMVGVMVAAAGLAAFALLSGDHGKAKASPYPAAWDPRIAPYAKIAEKQRGLRFLHPVAVRFLDDAAFTKTVQTDETSLSAEDRLELERSAGLLRAFGLLSGKVDLASASNDVSGAGVLAYYSFADKRVTIRGRTLVPAARPTLVHELTHALQDQHFGVGDRLDVLAKQNAKSSTTEYDVLHAIVEGDAQRMGAAYLASLSPAQQRQVTRSSRIQEQRARAGYAKAPPVLVTFFTAPYTFGEALVRAVAQGGGNQAVDDLLRDAPRHDAALLDPFRVLLGDKDAQPPSRPSVGAGDKTFDSGELGAVTWYLMLAQRLPVTEALTTVDGWAGDSYVAYVHDGVSCARAAFAGTTGADTARMFEALQRWIAAVPGTPASVQRGGTDLLFQSCDPGTSARVTTHGSGRAVATAVSRTYIGVAVLKAGAPDQYARCIADKLVHAYSIAQLNDPQLAAKDPSVRTRVARMAASCR